MKQNIVIAYIFNFFYGLGIGASYITRYIIPIAATYHFGFFDMSFVLVALAFWQFVSYITDVTNGYRADMHGEKITIFLSMLSRVIVIGFFLIAIALPEPSPYLFISLVLFAYFLFGLSNSFLSGNFEEWVQKQCDESNSLQIFSNLYTLFCIGLVVGLSACIFLLPADDYQHLFISSIPPYAVYFFGFFAAGLVFFQVKNTRAFSFKDLMAFFKSFAKTDQEAKQKFNDDIAKAKQDLKRNRDLNQTLWVRAGLYGVYMALEALIPVYVFISQDFTLTQKFILLIVCTMLPGMFGSIFKGKKKTSAVFHLKQLNIEINLFFFLVIMIAVISIFPFAENAFWYQDPVFLAFCVAIILHEVVYGSILPQFNDYSSNLARSTSEFPKTVLSIGERRKKIGAILSILVSASAAMLQIKEAFFWMIALMALLCMLYSLSVFRRLLHTKPQNADVKES